MLIVSYKYNMLDPKVIKKSWALELLEIFT